MTLYNHYNPAGQVDARLAANLIVAFDAADVHWLRGYCNLLMASDEMILAYEWKEPFERAGHVFFPRVQSKHKYLQVSESYNLVDGIAFVHLLNVPVREPERMKSSLEHLKEVVRLRRLSWQAIDAETDDDHEWIPNTRQTGMFPGVRINRQMIDGWRDFLAEADNILAGKTLVPHPRLKPNYGINVNKIFTNPKRFDLVLWVQGTGL